MRTTSLVVGWLVVSGIGALVFAGCGTSSQGTCADTLTCTPDAGSDGAATDGPPTQDGPVSADGESDVVATDAPPDAPPGCDPLKDPKDSAPCVVDAYGIFVDATKGLDTNAGTKQAPFKTIGAAILKAATATQKRIYVCEGTYAEHVVLDAQHDGISLYGGFACADWSYSGVKAKVVPADAGYALRIDGLTQDIFVEDLDMAAQPATGQDPSGAGKSSVAAFITASKTVTLRRVALTAGNGTSATNAAAPATNLFSANIGDLQGNGATGATGGAAKACACKSYGTSSGGKGGDGKAPQADPGLAGSGNPAATTMGVRDSAGGAGENGLGSCTGGHNGPDGAARGSSSSAATYGALTQSGWVPSAGGDGLGGNPGAGGGGGGGGLTDGAGGGGCGACGGAGGLGGKGAGASIALLVFNTTVKLEASSLKSGNAGKGGDASAAENGGGGGGGSIGACSGGRGGNGAGGGGGAGGTGGVSLGVGYVSPTAPSLDAATAGAITLGTAGTPGALGAAGTGGINVLGTAPSGPPGVAGKAGIAQGVLSLQ